MRVGLSAFVCVAFFAFAVRPAVASEKIWTGLDAEVTAYLANTDEIELTAEWKNGLHFRSADGNINIHIGGRLVVDTAWQWTNDELDSIVGEGAGEDATFIRAARIRVEGRIYKYNIFRMEYEFAASDEVSFRDLWFGLEGLKYFPHLRLGNQKVPQSLEFMMSALDIMFLERSAATQAFVRTRDVGVGVFNHSLSGPEIFRKQSAQRGFHHLTFAFGIYRPTDNDSASLASDNGLITALRTTYLWINRHTRRGRKMLHTGFSYLYAKPPEGTFRFDARGTIAEGPVYLDTGPIPADHAQVLGFEFAYILGPFSVQGEYYFTKVDGDATDPDFWGAYIYASYTLTGESRNYRGEEQGTFGRVQPWQRFHDGDGGPGAISVAVRFERTDLKDAGVDGGIWTAFTFGVNWYWNANTRVALNYVTGVLEEGAIDDGTINAIMMRVQIAW